MGEEPWKKLEKEIHSLSKKGIEITRKIYDNTKKRLEEAKEKLGEEAYKELVAVVKRYSSEMRSAAKEYKLEKLPELEDGIASSIILMAENLDGKDATTTAQVYSLLKDPKDKPVVDLNYLEKLAKKDVPAALGILTFYGLEAIEEMVGKPLGEWPKNLKKLVKKWDLTNEFMKSIMLFRFGVNVENLAEKLAGKEKEPAKVPA